MPKLKKEAQEQLTGIVKEQVDEQIKGLNDEVRDLKDALEKEQEERAKYFEDNEELKAKYDSLQNKKFKASEKLGGQSVVFKGYNPDFNKNFKGDLTVDEAEQVAKCYLAMAHGKAIDFASEMPQGYGTTILGLSELSSSALSTMHVFNIDRPVFSAPVKATRETSDAQASATANTSTSITAASITWTIDKRIGSYAEVRVDQLEDALFDIVNGWVVPLQAEGIGQYVDAEVFNGTNSEFTTSIIDVTAAVTASGSTAIGNAITFANLNTMFNHVEWERGLNDCLWYGSRAALKDIRGLRCDAVSASDGKGLPIFQEVPINGRPSQTLMGCRYVITPKIANAPDNGAMRLCFGDPSKYTICLRGNLQNLVNPYIKMKEDVVQFIAKLRADGNINDNATAASSGAFAVMSRVDS